MQTLLENKPLMIGAGVVAILIGALLLLVIARMLFGGKLRMPGGRTRQARLGIVDAFDLDRQRQLIIVRRDNTEHLIMIGGPNDLLIESEIVRVEAREGRDTRRDKLEAPGPTLPLAPGFGEPRIAASFVPSEPAQPPISAQVSPFSLDNTPIPAPLPTPPIPASPSPDAQPVIPQAVPKPEPVLGPVTEPVAPPPRRTPTFPLPPRRPPPQPTEPRVAVPPRPAESVTRSEPTPPSLEPTIVAPDPAVPVPAPRPVPPPFLRPLPPRPAKILQRTPATSPAAPVQQTPPSVDVAQPKAVPPLEPTPNVGAAKTGPVGETPVKDTSAKDSLVKDSLVKDSPVKEAPAKDTLESLEEEMAKLLGRGGDR